MKKAVTALVLAAAMAVAPVAQAVEPVAAPATTESGPLAPGEAAGVQKAQGIGGLPYEFWIAGGIILIIAIVLLLNGDDDDDTTTPTTNP